MTSVALPPAEAGGVTGHGPVHAPSEQDIQRIAAINDPIVRNLQITQAYHDLSGAMASLTGPGANWCTIATWASKQAGQSIRREDLVVAFERLLRDTPEAEDSAGALLQAAGRFRRRSRPRPG